ncbi:MaoC family dehydratase N-terminal domain-containing protein [Micrococcales bacterium 31B]|nr:MaoC family dehydratase N-terminal domain-containing protein [Micrococcales bacterium 31B]
MAVNVEYQGKVYPPGPPYLVGREKVREFAAATGATNALHHDLDAARAAGHPDLIAPPTFAVIMAQGCERQLVEDPEAGIDYSRVVHGDEKFVLHRPIVAGDELRGVLNVETMRIAGGHGMVGTRVDLLDADDHIVANVHSVIVVRGDDK